VVSVTLELALLSTVQYSTLLSTRVQYCSTRVLEDVHITMMPVLLVRKSATLLNLYNTYNTRVHYFSLGTCMHVQVHVQTRGDNRDIYDVLFDVP
jgi:hypothetical protein